MILYGWVVIDGDRGWESLDYNNIPIYSMWFVPAPSHVCDWTIKVLLLRRHSPVEVFLFFFFALLMMSPPLPPHLTNYCTTFTPLMKPGTCPSVWLWAWLGSIYTERAKSCHKNVVYGLGFFLFLFLTEIVLNNNSVLGFFYRCCVTAPNCCSVTTSSLLSFSWKCSKSNC